MALGLVARSAVAVADSLNSFYRVLKGTDPDNVYVRLPTAGSFEVRHSVTNAPVLRVTDAGLSAPIDGALVQDGTITSAELADGTIVNADVNAAAGVVVSKLAAGGTANRVVATNDGATMAMQQVTSSMVADNTLVDADVNSAAAIVITKLAHVGATNVLKSNGTVNVGAQVVDADVSAGAGIAVTKVAHVGANNVLKSTGSANVGGQVLNADVAAGAAIAYSKLNLASSITSADIVDGAIMNADVNAAAAIAYSKLNLANSIVTGDIVDGTLLNADVNAAAAIAITKLADVGANNVLRSSGAGNVAGKIVTNDMVINTINADRLTDGTITASKLGAGITAPAVAQLATSGVMAVSQPSVSFNGISQAYTSLEIRVYGKSTAAAAIDTVKLTINNVTSASYFGQTQYSYAANNLAGESLGAAYVDIGGVPAANATPAVPWMGQLTIWLHGYSGTTMLKTVHGVSYTAYGTATASQQVQSKGAILTGTSVAVTRVDVFPAGGQWAAGSIVTLYGYL